MNCRICGQESRLAWCEACYPEAEKAQWKEIELLSDKIADKIQELLSTPNPVAGVDLIPYKYIAPAQTLVENLTGRRFTEFEQALLTVTLNVVFEEYHQERLADRTDTARSVEDYFLEQKVWNEMVEGVL